MRMNKLEAEAVGMLRGGNIKAWKIFMDFIEKKYNFERDQCVDIDDDFRNRIHRGKARAFKEIKNIETEVDRIFRTGRQGE